MIDPRLDKSIGAASPKSQSVEKTPGPTGLRLSPPDRLLTTSSPKPQISDNKHVLTEDIVHREVTPDQKLLSRRLLTKTNRMPRWAERLFPANVAHSVYILEDSIVDPQNQTMTTFTWNINHARLMVVEERCVYCVNPDNSGWTEIRREAWVSSSLFGVSRAVQEFGLARFKSNVTKTMKGFEYILAKLQGEAPSKTLVETAKEAKEKAKETALAATEKAKDLANKAATKQQQQQLV
uniref:PRELI domain containing 1 n=1 Tax=Peromyscus maniculatus bairdii TaxID=230844 RepID=A0A8C8TJ56_PERMB